MNHGRNARHPQPGALPAPDTLPTPARARASLALNEEIAALYDAHAAGLLRFAAARSNDSDLAREMVQESFLRYMQMRQRGESIANPRAWLFRVAKNYLLDQLRRDRHTSDETAPHPIAGHETDPASLLALAGLEDRLKEILSARELECSMLRASGCSYEEIAECMSLSAGTVGSMLWRVTRKLSGLNPDAPAAPAARAAGHHSE